MPLKQCMKNGKSGWKYGDSGECYTGPMAKQKAVDQAVAVHASKGREAGLSGNKLSEYISSHMKSEG